MADMNVKKSIRRFPAGMESDYYRNAAAGGFHI
jgi:hypothetical protein